MREAIRGHQGEEHLMREAIRGHQGEEHQLNDALLAQQRLAGKDGQPLALEWVDLVRRGHEDDQLGEQMDERLEIARRALGQGAVLGAWLPRRRPPEGTKLLGNVLCKVDVGLFGALDGHKTKDVLITHHARRPEFGRL